MLRLTGDIEGCAAGRLAIHIGRLHRIQASVVINDVTNLQR